MGKSVEVKSFNPCQDAPRERQNTDKSHYFRIGLSEEVLEKRGRERERETRCIQIVERDDNKERGWGREKESHREKKSH